MKQARLIPPINVTESNTAKISIELTDKDNEENAALEKIKINELSSLFPNMNSIHRRFQIDQAEEETFFKNLKKNVKEKPKQFTADIAIIRNYDETVLYLAKVETNYLGSPGKHPDFVILPKSIVDHASPTFFEDHLVVSQNIANSIE